MKIVEITSDGKVSVHYLYKYEKRTTGCMKLPISIDGMNFCIYRLREKDIFVRQGPNIVGDRIATYFNNNETIVEDPHFWGTILLGQVDGHMSMQKYNMVMNYVEQREKETREWPIVNKSMLGNNIRAKDPQKYKEEMEAEPKRRWIAYS